MTKTASERGKANVRKGKENERNIVRGLRPWFPDVKRARDNGSAWTPDEGDIAGTGPALFWSCKDVTAVYPRLLQEWLDECQEKAGPNRIGLLVVKRKGHTDPLDYWCWLRHGDLVQMSTVDGSLRYLPELWKIPVRLELRHALLVLQAANYTHARPGLVSPPSEPGESPSASLSAPSRPGFELGGAVR